MCYFTICIPTYNRSNTIIRTLESIRKQAYTSYEVLIIDDGSIDNSKEQILDYITKYKLEERFKYYYKTNGGKHTVLNMGIELAKGEFFLILDSDDWLCDNALMEIKEKCALIEENDEYCGIMGRAIDIHTGKMIGDEFSDKEKESSYFDFHFIMPQYKTISDCVEVNKTKILKEYKYPEPKNCKFVPEAIVFDQIGVKYKLLLSNDIYRKTEYMADGMTRNPDFKKNNYVGFLYHYINRINNVIPEANVSIRLKFKLYILSWFRYWEIKKYDINNEGPTIQRITIIGWISRVLYPIIDRYIKTRKR